MTIFSSTQPSLRARVLPRFPAQVLAGNGISITKSGASYTFALASPLNLPVTSLQSIPSDRLLGRDSTGTGPVEILTAASGLGFNGAGGLEMSSNQRFKTFTLTIRGGTEATPVAIGTGVKGDIYFSMACTLVRTVILLDQAPGGTAFKLSLWKDISANFPPVVGDSIMGTANFSIASPSVFGFFGTTGMTTVDVAAGDIIRLNVDTTSTVTRAQVFIDVITV